MGKIIQRLVMAGVVLLAATPAPARAGQQPVQVRGGEEVIVTQSGSGEELRGRILELSSSSLAILVDGRRVEVPIDAVLRIDGRKDSLKNGTLIGLGVFAGLGALSCPSFDSPGWCAYGIALNAGLGAAIGAGIDALHKGRSPIYVKAGRSEAGLQVRLRF